MHPVQLIPLTERHVAEIAAIHIAAFPKSALTLLGGPVVSRYYAWLLHPTHADAYIRGAVQGDRLVGFNFAGRFQGAMSGFLARERRLLTLAVLRRPWLIVTNELFRARLTQAVRILNPSARRVSTAPSPDAQIRREAYLRGFGILAIAVDPRVQGAGVGKLLMHDAEQEARRRGVTVLNLSVARDNVQAIAFYERLGWTRATDDDGQWRGTMIRSI